MQAHDRELGGIRCLQILEVLSDYLDGELDRETCHKIEAHLRECDWCERFGGQFLQTFQDLRRMLGPGSQTSPSK